MTRSRFHLRALAACALLVGLFAAGIATNALASSPPGFKWFPCQVTEVTTSGGLVTHVSVTIRPDAPESDQANWPTWLAGSMGTGVTLTVSSHPGLIAEVGTVVDNVSATAKVELAVPGGTNPTTNVGSPINLFYEVTE